MHDLQNKQKQKIGNGTKGKHLPIYKRVVSSGKSVLGSQVYAKHKKWAARNFCAKVFQRKGNWAEKLILTLSDAFCLNFQHPPPRQRPLLLLLQPIPHPPAPSSQLFFGHFDAKHVASCSWFALCFVGQNLVRVPLSLSALHLHELFKIVYSTAFFFFFYYYFFLLCSFFLIFYGNFCCANFECCFRSIQSNRHPLNNKMIQGFAKTPCEQLDEFAKGEQHNSNRVFIALPSYFSILLFVVHNGRVCIYLYIPEL